MLWFGCAVCSPSAGRSHQQVSNHRRGSQASVGVGTPPHGLVVVLLQASLERRDQVSQQGHVPGPPPEGLSYFCVNLRTVIILIPVVRGARSNQRSRRAPPQLIDANPNQQLTFSPRGFTRALFHRCVGTNFTRRACCIWHSVSRFICHF